MREGNHQPPPHAVSEILVAVSRDGLLRLHKAYHAQNIADGGQWILWIKQDINEKAVYCDNNFPAAITAFAESLDAVLSKSGLGQARWERVQNSERRLYQKELWDSIKR